MSINVSINGDEGDTRTPLVDNLMRFDTLSEKISENIETLKDYIDVLTEYKEKMGTVEDTRSMRRRMNNEITEGNDLIKRILEDFRELEDLKFKRRKDIDNFNKMVRRLNHSFDEHYQKFTKVLKEIHSREKIFLELRQSTTLHPESSENTSVNTNSYNVNPDDDFRESVEESTRNLHFYSSIIEERENQLADVRKLASEMNMLAQAQSKKIHDQVGDLITLVEDTSNAEKDTGNANNELAETLKRQQKTTKKNLVITVIIILLCLVVITIVLSSL